MPTRKFSLDPGGPKRVEISWRGFWKEITVKVDGYVVGTIADKKALIHGHQFALPDGSCLGVQLAKSFAAVQLRVTRNGQPLPGSDSDPSQQLKVAYGVIFFIAGLNIVLGLIAVLTDTQFLTGRYGIDWTTIVFGVVFLLLGFLVKGRSMVALAVAVALFLASGIWAIYIIGQAIPHESMPAGGIFMRIFLLIPMFKGFGAIRDLKASELQPRQWPR
ncbi:MAG: hypothetical protein QOJ64_875 [Acidobacteriota bacterium]|jgi:hypothetical protein|nr:hypothetical protein [Acidobacteriota bacterium]